MGRFPIAECAVVAAESSALTVEWQAGTADEIVLRIGRLVKPLVLLVANLRGEGVASASFLGTLVPSDAC